MPEIAYPPVIVAAKAAFRLPDPRIARWLGADPRVMADRAEAAAAPGEKADRGE
jgi:hypothetical protein